MDKNENLTLQDVKSVVAHAVDWWLAAISNKGATPQQLKDFQSILSIEVQTELAINSYVTLQTDYYPEEFLAKAALRAEVKGAMFPQKVLMDITPYEVGVSQNHAKRELLFSIQKKTKLKNNSKENQMDMDLLS